MSKVLRTVVIVVAVAALVVVTAGAALGVAAASALGTSLAAGAAAGVVSVAGAIGISASLLVSVALAGFSALFLTPHTGSASNPGTQVAFKLDPQAPIPYVIGRTAVGGNIIYRGTHGQKNKFQTIVTVLSGAGPVQSIDQLLVENVATSFGADGNATGPYRGYMWHATQLGQKPETSAIQVPASAGSSPYDWTTSCKTSGLATSIWTLAQDDAGKLYPSGTPKPLWVLHGVKVYDPRLDSTYPGGSGTCRSNDETTWVWSENPHLHGLAWALRNGASMKQGLGVGAPIAMIDVASFVAGANISDANSWKAGGQISSSDSKWEALKSILQAGAAEPIRTGAMLSCRTITTGVSLATLTSLDLMGDYSVQAMGARRDRLNTVVANYRSEAHSWEQIAASLVTVAAYVTADGGQRSREALFPFVQQLAQAGQLARYAIEEAREFGPIQLIVGPRWLGYRPGDMITVNVPACGLNGQLCKIDDRQLDASTGLVTLTLRSETTAKHAFALGQTTTAPPAPGVTPPPTVTASIAQAIVDRVARDRAADLSAEADIRGVLTARANAAAAATATADAKATAATAIAAQASAVTIATTAAASAAAAAAAQTRLLAIQNSSSSGLTINGVNTGIVTISNHTRVYADGSRVSVTGDTIYPGNGVRGWIYYDQVNRAGGTVTYQYITVDDGTAFPNGAQPDRHFVGSFTVPAAAGSPIVGGPIRPPGYSALP